MTRHTIDDCCSEVAFKLLQTLERYRDLVSAFESALDFQRYMKTMVYRKIIDWLRVNAAKDKSIGLEYCTPTQVPVPRQVDLKMAMEELPQRIAEFVISRDRFCFGERSIRLVCKLLVLGKPVPVAMLKNWFDVPNAERCLPFCVLMSRLYLYKFRDEFADILDPESGYQVRELGSQVHIFES